MTGSPSRSRPGAVPAHPATGGSVPLPERGCRAPWLRCDLGEGLTERLTDTVRLPLENLEFTVAEYLLANGARIDPGTRLLLARIRDSMGEIAAASRGLASVCAAREAAGKEAADPRSMPAPARERSKRDGMADAL